MAVGHKRGCAGKCRFSSDLAVITITVTTDIPLCSSLSAHQSPWTQVKNCWLPVKFIPGCPGPPRAPPALQLGMQAKKKVSGGTVVSLSRRWPAWPAQRTPCSETWHACQAKKFIWEFELGWLCGAAGNPRKADVSQNPAQPGHPMPTETASDGMGSLGTLMLAQLLSPGPGSGLADEIQLLRNCV
eukprot:1160746-Pelagomonas_calceolata.AAC.4